MLVPAHGPARLGEAKERPHLSRHHPRPWHCASEYGPGPRRPLDREQRGRFRFLLNVHARAGRLTEAAVRVGEALVRRLGTEGRCDPSQATLGDDARCSDRTVRRAIAALHTLGLIAWTRRIVRAGWRAEQTSNAYELCPEADAPPMVRCGGHSVRAIRNIDSNQRADEPPEARHEAQAALARFAEASQARLAAAWRARLLGKGSVRAAA